MSRIIFLVILHLVLILNINADIGFDGEERAEHWPSRFLKRTEKFPTMLL